MPVKEHESTLPGSGLVDVCYFTAPSTGVCRLVTQSTG